MKPMLDDFPSLGGENFPSLGGRPAGNGAPGGGQQFGGLGGLGGVANMAYGTAKSKKQSPEFNMSEDMFPALPGGAVGGLGPAPGGGLGGVGIGGGVGVG